jgi:hypothetical protein
MICHANCVLLEFLLRLQKAERYIWLRTQQQLESLFHDLNEIFTEMMTTMHEEENATWFLQKDDASALFEDYMDINPGDAEDNHYTTLTRKYCIDSTQESIDEREFSFIVSTFLFAKQNKQRSF